MAERRNKANKLDQYDWDGEASVETETPSEVPMPKHLMPLALPAPAPSSADESKGVDVVNRIEVLESELLQLKKRQEAMEQKHLDVEAIRRGQLDCLSERVYEAEKTQRQVQERTDDAIEKARAAFQKTASDMEHERANLMCVINQVNQNFEHLSREMAQLSDHEHHGGHLHEIRESQHSLSQQILEMQCQLMPVVEQDRSMGSFKQEVGVYLEQLSRLRKEVSMSIADEVRRHMKDSAVEDRRPMDPPRSSMSHVGAVRSETRGDVLKLRRSDAPLSAMRVEWPNTLATLGFRHQANQVTDDSAKVWLDADRPSVAYDERFKKSRAFPQAKDSEESASQDYRLLELLMAQDRGPPRSLDRLLRADEGAFEVALSRDVWHGRLPNLRPAPRVSVMARTTPITTKLDRHFHVSRVVNLFTYRQRDTTPMAILEYVDRPGEPAPVKAMGLKRQADNDVEEIDDCQEVVTVPGPRRPHKGQALSSRFSPVAEEGPESKQGPSMIAAAMRGFSMARRRLLGRVDGEIPKAQLVHLLRRAAAPATPGDPEVERRSQRKVLRSASLKALNFDELTGIAQDLAAQGGKSPQTRRSS
eukprot:g32606.t1